MRTLINATRQDHVDDWLRAHPDAVRALGCEDYRRDDNLRRGVVTADVALLGAWPLHFMRRAGAYLNLEYTLPPAGPIASLQDMEAHLPSLQRYICLRPDELVAVVEACMGRNPASMTEAARAALVVVQAGGEK
jgi:hypothetical protein